MKRSGYLIAMALATSSFVRAQPAGDELQVSRQRFEQLRKRPEQLERLRAEAKAFLDLPEERRQQITEVHEQLNREAPATQARLQVVLDRYADWLGSLDKATREKIEQAPDKQKRLALIREIREQQWLKEQPKALRDQIAALQGEERKELIAKEKKEERRRRVEWIIASRFWSELEGEAKGRKVLPTKFAELPLPVRDYVRDYLLKMFLNQEEKDQLAGVEGQWPQYPMKLVELASKHPAALPGNAGPKSIKELPNEVLLKLRLLKKDAPIPVPKKEARLLEAGNWPAFGSSLAKVAKLKKTAFDHEFLAYDRDCLTKEMQEFLKKRLEPALNRDDLKRLYDSEGKWPEYPKTIQELADRHQLRPPWFILPPGEDWNKYRLGLVRR
jgi:hypothetical protein